MSSQTSNAYIFRYAVIMVIIVATLLSSVSFLLKDKQDRNVRIEKIQGILKSAGIETTKENAEELYKNHIIKEITINVNGDIISSFNVKENIFDITNADSLRAFDVVLKSELKALKKQDAKKQPVFPIYVCDNNGKTIYIIPLFGKGLWGPVWGNIALKEDFNTVIGVVFDHKSETPGLGAEISSYELFQKQFEGKKLFNNQHEFQSITVVKGGVKNSNLPEEHAVDAISGGTITSDGVSDMLKDCLNIYESYIKKNK